MEKWFQENNKVLSISETSDESSNENFGWLWNGNTSSIMSWYMLVGLRKCWERKREKAYGMQQIQGSFYRCTIGTCLKCSSSPSWYSLLKELSKFWEPTVKEVTTWLMFWFDADLKEWYKIWTKWDWEDSNSTSICNQHLSIYWILPLGSLGMFFVFSQDHGLATKAAWKANPKRGQQMLVSRE